MKAGYVKLAMVSVATLLGCRSASDTPGTSTSSALIPIARESASAQVTLDALDRRTPVPLLAMMANHQKQNMRDHLLAVQEIIAAVGTKDFDAVQGAATRIGYSEQMGQMCQHMGAATSGFTELALKFHHTADKIKEAAKKHDGERVLDALGDTLAICTTCHQTFKQQVVDDAAWSTLAKMAPPTGLTHE